MYKMLKVAPKRWYILTVFLILCMLFLTACSASSTVTPAPSGTPAPGATLLVTVPTPSTGCGKLAPTSPGTSVYEAILVDGLERTYLLHLPAGYQANSSQALVLNFHGHGGNAALQERETKMSLLADQQGFIVVYPQGVVGPDHQTGWNTGIRESPKVNDVLFVSDLLNHLQSVLCIDPQRISATGFSNGGGMTNVLACTLAGRLAAFAPVSGSYPPYPGGCHPVRPVPILEFHGTDDRVVPYGGSPVKNYPPITTWLNEWVTRDGCTTRPTTFYKQANVTGQEWTNCGGSSTIVHFTIQAGGHDWPKISFNVSFNPPDGTPETTGNPLSATALIWSFFQKHPLSVTK